MRLSGSSFLRLRSPVCHHRELQTRGLLPIRHEEEAISRRHHRITFDTICPQRCEIEQCPGRARLEAAARLQLCHYRLQRHPVVDAFREIAHHWIGVFTNNNIKQRYSFFEPAQFITSVSGVAACDSTIVLTKKRCPSRVTS